MTIEEYLKQWEGYTADEVANILRWKGMKGTRHNPSFCPISRDIKKDTGLLGIRVFGSVLVDTNTSKQIPINNRGLSKFIHEFDHLYYRDLIKR